MKTTIALLPVVLAMACAPAFVADPTPPPVMRWQASVTGTPQFEAARADATAIRTVGGTTVEIRFAGGEPGATHPWHVHHGSCAQRGGIVGEPAEYPPLQVGTDGTATATALVEFELQEGQPFHINVHRSPAELGTIVACGELVETGPR
jgi:hypothetical protein